MKPVMDEESLMRWLYDHETTAECETELSVMSKHHRELFKGRVLVDAEEWQRLCGAPRQDSSKTP